MITLYITMSISYNRDDTMAILSVELTDLTDLKKQVNIIVNKKTQQCYVYIPKTFWSMLPKSGAFEMSVENGNFLLIPTQKQQLTKNVALPTFEEVVEPTQKLTIDKEVKEANNSGEAKDNEGEDDEEEDKDDVVNEEPVIEEKKEESHAVDNVPDLFSDNDDGHDLLDDW